MAFSQSCVVQFCIRRQSLAQLRSPTFIPSRPTSSRDQSGVSRAGETCASAAALSSAISALTARYISAIHHPVADGVIMVCRAVAASSQLEAPFSPPRLQVIMLTAEITRVTDVNYTGDWCVV